MLLVISDLHMTDETTACNVHATAFGYLRSELESAVRVRDAEDVHVLLLGDIFDLVRTDYWLRKGLPRQERPWGGKLNPNTAMNVDDARNEAQFQEILRDILKRDNVRYGLLDFLNNLPVGKLGRPARVTYVIGNHDRVLHNYPSLCRVIRDQLPKVDLQFATRFTAPEYGVFARHGHEYDALCHGWEFSNKVMRTDRSIDRFSQEAYQMMALGEVLTAELMSGLIYRTISRLPQAGKRTPEQQELIRNLVEINNLRPTTDVFRWLAWFTRGKSNQIEQLLFECLIESLNDLLESSLAKRWDEIQVDWIVSGDLTDYLVKLRAVLKAVSTSESLRGALVDIVGNLGRSGESPVTEDELYLGARQEWKNLGDDQYQYLLYGHTHDALHRCLSARTDGIVSMYINTGTYLPLIQRTDDGAGFYSEHRMTIAFFYKESEDSGGRVGNGPTADIWNGFRRKLYAPSLAGFSEPSLAASLAKDSTEGK
jgi:UDP-2,3-diacylglucosamine pyrophosphatase LpxH